MPEFCNPFDFFINIISEEANTVDKLYDNYNKLCEEEVRDEKTKKHEIYKNKEIISLTKNPRQVNWLLEFFLLLKRTTINYVRNLTLFLSRLFNVFMVSLIIMGFYWNFGGKKENLFHNFFGFFFNNTHIFFVSGMNTTLLMLPSLQFVLKRESSANLYRISTFYCAMLITLLINSFYYSTVFTLIEYFTNGLYSDVEHFALYYLLNVFAFTFGQYFGLFIGSFLPGKLGIVVAPFVFLFFLLGSGFYKGNASMPSFISWLFNISPYKYFLEIYLKLFANATEITKHLPEMLDYQFGIENCIYVLSGYLLFVIVLGLIGTKFITSKF
jgi:hypothetical protein